MSAREVPHIARARLVSFFGSILIVPLSTATVTLSSTTAYRGWANQSDYGVAKAAVRQLTENLAIEWAGLGIRVNSVAPGHTLNPMVQEMIDQARIKGSGVVDYVWRNPVTNAVERKRTFIQRVENSLLGVGYYLD